MLKTDISGAIQGSVCLQVNDSLIFGTEAFMKEEEKAKHALLSKQRSNVGKGVVRFNGTQIRSIDGVMYMTATLKI